MRALGRATFAIANVENANASDRGDATRGGRAKRELGNNDVVFSSTCKFHGEKLAPESAEIRAELSSRPDVSERNVGRFDN